MPTPATSKTVRLMMLLWLPACPVLVCLDPAGAESIRVAEAGFDRPAPELVRQTTRDILREPRFRPHKTFWQWLAEKLSSWKGPDLDISETWAKILVYFLLAWCVLALLAVLGHFIWSMAQLIGERLREPLRGGVRFPGHADVQLSYEHLKQRADELARQGAYREAAAATLMAVIRRLDDAGHLDLHQSKTNGDYVGELATASIQGAFQRLAFAVDRMTFGGATCDQAEFRDVNQTAEHICSHVERQTI